MALPLPPGLTPAEVAFLCEMELVTVLPRQRLEALDLLGVSTSPQYASSRSISRIKSHRYLAHRERRQRSILPTGITSLSG